MTRSPSTSNGSLVDAAELELRQHARRQVVAAGVEGVGERLADDLFDLVGAVDRQRPAELLREEPQVVEAEQVIGVVVRVQDRVDELDVLAEQLQPQFRAWCR